MGATPCKNCNGEFAKIGLSLQEQMEQLTGQVVALRTELAGLTSQVYGAVDSLVGKLLGQPKSGAGLIEMPVMLRWR